MRGIAPFLLPALVFAQGLTVRIDRIIDSTPGSRQAIWGVHVVDLRTGGTIYSRHADRFFIPASNTKLFSTALALTKLGADHRFQTLITAPTPIDSEGRVSELRFVGGGDPNLSGRVLPYENDAAPVDPLRYIEQFAQQLVDDGLKRVDGDIVGDDSAYEYDPYPEGWALDDPIYDYGAPVSALIVNDGTFTLRMAPDGTYETKPAVPGLVVHNRAVQGSTTRLSFVRLPGNLELTITGTISKAYESLMGVEDQALFAAELLREALLRRGVQIGGAARVEHTPTSGVNLLTHRSQPLIEDLRATNKESLNLHAEIALLEVARIKRGVGSRKEGLTELKAFLKEIGIKDDQYYFKDGSGLSRQTLVTPTTMTKLLTFMYASPNREAWQSTLPIGGEDGTLDKRFAGAGAASSILAKTGSIMHVNALAGYAGDRYAFSIMVNNSNVPASQIRRVIDQVALALVSGSETRRVPVSKQKRVAAGR